LYLAGRSDRSDAVPVRFGLALAAAQAARGLIALGAVGALAFLAAGFARFTIFAGLLTITALFTRFTVAAGITSFTVAARFPLLFAITAVAIFTKFTPGPELALTAWLLLLLRTVVLIVAAVTGISVLVAVILVIGHEIVPARALLFEARPILVQHAEVVIREL
jgi:hypothetical protein